MAIYLKLKRRKEKLANIDTSKFLGDPVMPEKFNSAKLLDDDDIFLCQFRCEDIAKFDKDRIFPDKGMLSFFVGVAQYPYIAKVFYYTEEPETVLEEWNELWTDNLSDAYAVMPCVDCVDNAPRMLYSSGGDIELLRLNIRELSLPVLNGIERDIAFAIDKADLSEKAFGKTRLVIEE